MSMNEAPSSERTHIAFFGCRNVGKSSLVNAVTGQELARLATEARLGGMISGKPGLVVLHMGTSEDRMAAIFWALKHSDVPAKHFLPTHCCRSP